MAEQSPNRPDKGVPEKGVPFGQSKASVSLDAMRGIAALLVCSDHCRHILFAEYHEVANRALFLPYAITSTGHQSVVIFFVLSGFLVGGSVFRSLDQNRWSWKRYLTHRFVRLWLVLIPALLLCFAWDSLGQFLHQHHLGLNTALLQQIPGRVPASPIQQRLGLSMDETLSTFLGNVFFLQTILVQTFGSNGPLWSLSYEFWYYLLFPCAVLAIRSRHGVPSRLLFAAGFFLMAFFVGKNICTFFPLWIMGAVLIYLPRPRCSFLWRVVATVIYSTIFVGCTQISRHFPIGSDYILGVATTFYLWLLLAAKERSSHGTGELLARNLARFSYTLYLVHMPFLFFLGDLLTQQTRWLPSLQTVSFAFVLWLAALLYAWIVAAATEFRVDDVKKWAEMRVDRLFPYAP
jgi:peptidoglycan/LPS O-acetylase OafA/YrhL